VTRNLLKKRGTWGQKHIGIGAKEGNVANSKNSALNSSGGRGKRALDLMKM